MDFKPNMRKNSNSYIFRSVYQIEMKFDRQLRPATETSWVVSYAGKTIPRWRMAAILKIDISPYLTAKNHPILMKFCTQQQILNWMNVTWSKMKKVALDRLRVRQNVFLVCQIKRDIGRKSWFFIPLEFGAPVRGSNRGSPSEYCHPVWCGNTRMVGLPDGEKFLDGQCVIDTTRTWVNDACTVVFSVKCLIR